MSEEEFLWDFITKTFPDDHVVIYLYTCGGDRSSENAINRALKECNDVFAPVYPIHILKELIIIFLDFKKAQYFRGKIKIKRDHIL